MKVHTMLRIIAAISTAVLLAISWPANGSLTPLVFGAFIPMLWLENQIRENGEKRSGRKVFLHAWLAFGLFNLFTTWWVSFAHWSGTAATTVINGALMATCFWLYHQVAKSLGRGRALLLLPVLWMPVEYLHMDWDMSFPWLNLGYVFANRPTWIQWYSYTGVWGGTFWVLWVNAYFFTSFLPGKLKATLVSWGLKSIFAILLPFGVSYWMYSSYEERGNAVEVVVVQPNLDPYTEKFMLSDYETIDRFEEFASPYLTQNTTYIVGPETMIGRGLDERSLSYKQSIRKIQELTEKYPNLNVVIGASTFATYHTPETSTAREMRNGDGYYDSFNTSMQLGGMENPLQLYHKTKLVVGVEKVPFVWMLGPLLKDGIDLGGATGTLGGQEERSVFVHTRFDSLVIGTPVCWEADFPGFTSEFVKNGAKALFAITNDGWWANTPGKSQHMYYASVRAIENRRDVVRSANTGISCYINQRGDISHQIPYGEDGAFAVDVHMNDELTIFSQMGDMIGRVSMFLCVALILSILVKRKTGR